MSKLFLALFLALTPTAFATIWYVDGVNGNDSNDCKSRRTACKTIGHAISLVSSGDTIGVGPATYTENLTINLSLRLIGSGASTTIIDGGSLNTVVTIASGANVTLSGFTIQHGVARVGGGIHNSGILTINNSTLTENVVTGSTNASAAGGGIYNEWFLTINNSTLNSNFAKNVCSKLCFSDGGGIYNAEVLTINNSTLNSNNVINENRCFDCGGSGGGIYSGGTLTINNSTLSGNGVAGSFGIGGNIAGIATLQNSIVANANSGGNCYGTMTSNGYNLSSDNTCNFTGPGDLNNTNPKLGTLGNNGGPTQTIPLLTGSPAIDAGNPNGCADGNGNLLKTDQRGKPRPDKEDTGGCDMGAFERQND